MRYLVYTYELLEGERTKELVDVILATDDKAEALQKTAETVERLKAEWEQTYLMVETICDARKQQWAGIPVGHDRAFIVGLMDEGDPDTAIHPRRMPERADQPSVQVFAAHDSCITTKPSRRSGQPCVRETRLTVHDVLGYLVANHCNVNAIQSDFPELSLHDINCCLEYAQTFLLSHSSLVKG